MHMRSLTVNTVNYQRTIQRSFTLLGMWVIVSVNDPRFKFFRGGYNRNPMIIKRCRTAVSFRRGQYLQEASKS